MVYTVANENHHTFQLNKSGRGYYFQTTEFSHRFFDLNALLITQMVYRELDKMILRVIHDGMKCPLEATIAQDEPRQCVH